MLIPWHSHGTGVILNWIMTTHYTSLVPRPSPSFLLLAVRSQALAQLLVACSTFPGPRSTANNGKLGESLGMRLTIYTGNDMDLSGVSSTVPTWHKNPCDCMLLVIYFQSLKPKTTLCQVSHTLNGRKYWTVFPLSLKDSTKRKWGNNSTQVLARWGEAWQNAYSQLATSGTSPGHMVDLTVLSTFILSNTPPFLCYTSGLLWQHFYYIATSMTASNQNIGTVAILELLLLGLLRNLCRKNNCDTSIRKCMFGWIRVQLLARYECSVEINAHFSVGVNVWTLNKY